MISRIIRVAVAGAISGVMLVTASHAWFLRTQGGISSVTLLDLAVALGIIILLLRKEA